VASAADRSVSRPLVSAAIGGRRDMLLRLLPVLLYGRFDD